MAILSNFQANGQEALKVLPPTQSNSLSYTGSAQSPTWTEYPTAAITIAAVTPQVNAGTYYANASLKSGCVWADTLKSGVRQLAWTISKIAGGGGVQYPLIQWNSVLENRKQLQLVA